MESPVSHYKYVYYAQKFFDYFSGNSLLLPIILKIIPKVAYYAQNYSQELRINICYKVWENQFYLQIFYFEMLI